MNSFILKIMKKFIYSALAVLMGAAMLVSCEEDRINPLSDEPVTHNVLPEVAVAGTYEGSWEVNKTNPFEYVGSYAGTITIEDVTDANYVALLTVSSSENSEINTSDVVNCFWSDDIVYLQNSVTTKFGSKGVVCSVDGDNISLVYFQSIKIGRKQYPTKIEFKGKKK